ncbi:hypothetical protein M0805_001859 [Coniferiporia weirii]|nr:hypothetical protein M0805_001859 [Coniferiporia weirii]
MNNIAQHPTLYFADGNIVLSALSTAHSGPTSADSNITDASDPVPMEPKSLLFRVHKSLLLENSVVFRDMLNLGDAPSGVNEEHDGAPVVQMPDSAEEVEDLLKTFYRPWEIWPQKYHPDTCLLLKNVLAMAIKYQFADIRKRIVAHVETDWPKTLEEWDWFENYVESIPPFQRYKYTNPEPAATAVLAWRFGIHRILPAVFYELSRISPCDDWDDISVSPALKSPEMPHPVFFSYISKRMVRAARWSLLEGDHFRVILRGRRRMELFIEEALNSLKIQEEFCDSGKCIKDRGKMIKTLCTTDYTRERDPLNALRLEGMDFGAVCETCRRFFKIKAERIRKKIWKKLPEFFELGDQCVLALASPITSESETSSHVNED